MGRHRKHTHGNINQLAALAERLTPKEQADRADKIQARATVAETLTRNAAMTQQFSLYVFNQHKRQTLYTRLAIGLLALLQLGFDLHHVLKVF
jgi:hypothetical protein